MAEISKQALKVDNNQSFPNNNNGAITPTILRAFNVNMIDSMVDELSYNIDSASWNSSISQLNVFTASASGLNTGSLLVTASAVSNVITFTKGNGSTFNVTVADTTDLSSLNAFTASAQVSLNNLNLWTSSYQPIITNLQASQSIDATKFTTIGTQSGSWDNTSLNSYTASNDTKWNTLGSLSGSFVTESETGSFARTDVSNTFTQQNNFTSISASSFVSASQFVGDGSKITNITASIALPILDEGIPQGNAFSMNFTGSAISAIVVGGTAVVSVNAISTASLNELTASFNTYTASTDAKFVAVGASTSSLNSFTQSQDIKNSTLATYTASVDSQLSSLTNATASYAISSSVAAVDAAQQSQINSLINATGSYITSSIPLTSLNAFTASQDTKNSTLATYTASVDSSLTNLNTFTASNGNTSLNSYTASNDTKWSNLAGQTGSYVTSAITASSLVTASVSLNTITFTKGDASTFNITVNTGSGGGTSDLTSLNAFTASQETKNATLGSLTGSFATTGSNTFIGNQTVTGSLFISGNINMVNGADIVTHHVKAAGSNGLELQNASSGIIVSMGAGGGTQASFVGAVTANSISASTITGIGNVTDYSTSVDSRLDGLAAATSSYVTSAITASSLVTASFSGNTLTFTKGDASTFGVVIPDVSGSTINTGSFATTGSNSFFGINSFSGAVSFTGSAPTILSSSFSGSLITNLTDVYTDVSAVNQIVTLTSASYAALVTGSLTNTNTLYIVSGSTQVNPAFPYTGSASISGSLILTGSAKGNVVSMSITSNTASMDFNSGNYFELTASVSPIRIEVSNLSGGVTSTLALNGVTSSTINFSSNVLQPSGSAYTASVSGSNDILSFVAFNSNKVNVVSTLKMI